MSDPLPYSENSVELILVSERYGANGIEIDVRLTKDGVPILYHDNTLNARLVQKTPMLGPVEEYTFPQLRTSVRLLRGELIPSLEEAFNAVVYGTNLKLVWLDLKTEGRDLISRIVPLVQEYTMQAAVLAEQGLRDTLEIMLGVPSDAIYDEILRYPSYTSLPTIAERSLDKARTLHSLVWAPVWSSGICRADNATARSEGRRIFVWTLDDPHFTQEYVDSFEYDGILSDYPMIVAYYHYVQ
jgi:glycerophosphoryl diester phosphodiesterase